VKESRGGRQSLHFIECKRRKDRLSYSCKEWQKLKLRTKEKKREDLLNSSNYSLSRESSNFRRLNNSNSF
jgi:hypothetical protein